MSIFDEPLKTGRKRKVQQWKIDECFKIKDYLIGGDKE